MGETEADVAGSQSWRLNDDRDDGPGPICGGGQGGQTTRVDQKAAIGQVSGVITTGGEGCFQWETVWQSTGSLDS